MKNQLVNLVKISALAVVVASASNAAFAQVGGAAPQVVAPAGPGVSTAPQFQLSSPVGRAFEAQAVQSVRNLGLPVERANALAKSVSEAMAATERQLIKSGQPVTTSALRSAFTKAITAGVAKEANAAGKVALAQSNLDSLMAKTTTADAAESVIKGQVAKATDAAANVANVPCDLTASTRAGITGAEGIVSRDGDLATAAQIEQLRAQALTYAKMIQDHVGLKNYQTVTVSSFTNVNGVPVASEVKGPVAAVDQFTAAASKDASSVEVLAGLVGFSEISVNVLTGIGKDVHDPNVIWSLRVGALVNKLTTSVGEATAKDIGYGVLVDANNDGKIDAKDGGQREGGIYKHCSVPLGGVAL